MPRIDRVVETGIYVTDLPRAVTFYEELFGFPRLFFDDRLCAFDVGGESVLLVFRQGGTPAPVEMPGGVVPPHDGSGPVHFALGIDEAEFDDWEQALRRSGIEIESRINWPRGGKSLYFRDPDGHSLELVTRRCWATY